MLFYRKEILCLPLRQFFSLKKAHQQSTPFFSARSYTCSMKIIYADTLFILNLAADYLLCLCTARLCSLRLHRLRYLAAALIGAVYSVAVYLPGLGALSGFLGIIPCAGAMCAAAYAGEKKFLRCCAVFFSAAAAFGGAVWALSMYGRFPVLNVKTLILFFAFFYALLRLVFFHRARIADKLRFPVTLCWLGRKSEFFALSDSGNTLTDPVSGCRVMVVSLHALRPVLHENVSVFAGSDAVRTLSEAAKLPALSGKLRLIPYSAVGTAGLLPVFRPDSLNVDGREEKDVLIAVSESVSGDGYEAVF